MQLSACLFGATVRAFRPARHLSVRDCSSLHLRLVRGATQAPIFSTLLYDDVDGPPYALILYQTFLALLAIGCVIVADKNAALWHPAPVVVAEPAQEEEKGEEEGDEESQRGRRGRKRATAA